MKNKLITIGIILLPSIIFLSGLGLFNFYQEPKLGLAISSSHQSLLPFVDSKYYLGTTTPSTIAWKNLITDEICLAGDCQTTWSAGSGETNTASNLDPTKVVLFDSKSGVDLRFNTLEAGSNISFSTSTSANNIVISSTGGSGGASAIATSTNETKGRLSYWTSTSGTPATLGEVATTSISAGTGLSFTGTLGALVGGVNGTLNAEVQTSDLHDEVTLAGTPDYITIIGQIITRNLVDLANDITGTLGVSNGGTGATTFTDNRLLTGNGTSAINDEANLTFDGSTLTVTADIVNNTKNLTSYANFRDGTFVEAFDALVQSDGTTASTTLEKSGGGDLTVSFSSGDYILDCAPTKCVTQIEIGTDSAPAKTYIYVLETDPTNLATSTSEFPTVEHAKVVFIFCPSASKIQTETGCFINQNWNDFAMNTNNEGGWASAGEQRRYGKGYWSGMDADGLDQEPVSSYFNYISDTESYFKATAGVMYQANRHITPAVDTSTTDDMHIVNSSVSAYREISDLTDITLDSTGVSLSNKYWNACFFVIGNKTGQYAPIMVTIPSGSYNSQINAENDRDNFDECNLPREFIHDSGVAVPVVRMTLKYSGGTGALTHASSRNLRDGVGITGGTSGGVTAFLSLTDTPSAYTSDAKKSAVVNSGETSLEFIQTIWADGSVALAGAWNMGSQNLTNVDIDSGTLDGITTLQMPSGDIGATGARITKGWFADLQVTNAIVGSVTGNAGTVTGFTPASGSLTLAGADALTITTTGTTNVTLPLGSNTLAANDQTFFIGTTQVAINRGSATLNLAGIGTLGVGAITSSGTLALGANNITTTGSLGATGAGRLTKGWFTDLDITNTITGSVSGNAGTVTSFTPAGGSLTLAGADALTITTTGVTNSTLPLGTKTLVATDVTTLSSLTSVGTLATLTVTATIVGSIDGNAATVTTIAGLAPDTATTQATQAAITSLGTLGNLTISTSGFLVIPASATCDSNADGEICHDTTDNQLIVDGAVVPTTNVKIWSVTVASTSPAFISGGLLAIPTQLDGYTMSAIRCKIDTGTNKALAIEDASANSTESITCLSSVTSDDGSITNAVVTAAEEMYINFGATSGAVDTVTISVFGNWTRE